MTTDCWEWDSTSAAHRSNVGYGYMYAYGKHQRATRVVWEEVVGPIPKGYEIDHLCRNTACVNPDHLEPVTHQENCRRGLAGHHMQKRTHCQRGHELSAENTYHRSDGHRMCRTCIRRRKNERRRRLAAEQGSWAGL
jgi:HNH endonuclease